MSFSKAQDLVRLARMAATRRNGTSLDDICAEFDISHRTAPRMTDALETTFVNVEVTGGEGRRWRFADRALNRLQTRQETTVEALDIAGNTALRDGHLHHVSVLTDLCEVLLARLSPIKTRHTVVEAMRSVTRAGPKVNLAPKVLDGVIAALRGPFRLRMRYGDSPERIVEPHGLLLGHRSYLEARKPGGEVRNFRMDRIHSVETLDESFNLADGFSLDDYATQSFGVYQVPAQFGEVVWRFTPKAAEFRIHLKQVLECQSDSSLIVRFQAAGWLEMTFVSMGRPSRGDRPGRAARHGVGPPAVRFQRTALRDFQIGIAR